SQMSGKIIIVNNSTSPVSAFVSKYNTPNGSDAWYVVPAGEAETWHRNGWELVAFKNAADTNRAGVYVQVDKTVIFNTLGHLVVN
ncbi:hypothetical protein C8Q70DRAFT_925898, partial [Cubamyces menziesii]